MRLSTDAPGSVVESAGCCLALERAEDGFADVDVRLDFWNVGVGDFKYACAIVAFFVALADRTRGRAFASAFAEVG